MIPVALPSTSQLIIAFVFSIATLLWVGLTLILVTRLLLARRPWASRGNMWFYLCLTPPALLTIGFWLLIQIEIDKQQRDYVERRQPVLRNEQLVGGINMPQGTKLQLSVDYDLASFTSAEFPVEVLINGVRAKRVTRYLAMQVDERHQTRGYLPQTMTLQGLGIVELEGWRCDASEPVEFSIGATDGVTFQRCVLAQGNRFDMVVLPAGAELMAIENTVYIDGHKDDDRWTIFLPEGSLIDIGGLSIHARHIALDAHKTLYKLSEAELAKDYMSPSGLWKQGSIVAFNLRQHRGLGAKPWAIRPSEQSEWQLLDLHL